MLFLAAGVLNTRLRRKKEETKAKLQTRDNLDRLEDIIYGLNNQIKPLAKQASLDEVNKDDLHLDAGCQIKENKTEN